jgi:hypothetical protein
MAVRLTIDIANGGAAEHICSMLHRAPRRIRTAMTGMVCALVLAATSPADAAQFLVGNEAGLKAAIATAIQNNDAANFIYLTTTPIYLNGPIVIQPVVVQNQTFRFSDGHRLLLCPNPQGGPARVEWIEQNPSGEIFDISDQGGVTIQNVDFLRDVTTLSGLMNLNLCTNVTLERCHVGYVSASFGTPHLEMLVIQYPTKLVIRNCDFFSVFPGAFETGIHVLSLGDNSNSLFLYNDEVSGCGGVGIRCDGTGPDSGLIVLRNNVVVNEPGLTPEPVAYSSGAQAKMRVYTSCNTAYSSAANAEVLDLDAQSIAGMAQGFLLLPNSVSETSGDFVTRTWDATPGALNPDFDHLEFAGGLHTPSRYGVTVTDGSPTGLDLKVIDDIDHEGRPSAGSVPHTDRGIDQVDPDLSAGVPAIVASRLWVAPRVNPTRSIELEFGAATAGRLTLELFDPAGRRLARTSREVAATALGRIALERVPFVGLMLYRVTLTSAGGGIDQAHGRLVQLR